MPELDVLLNSNLGTNGTWLVAVWIVMKHVEKIVARIVSEVLDKGIPVRIQRKEMK